MTESRIEQLIHAYLDGSALPHEIRELFDRLDAGEGREALRASILASLRQEAGLGAPATTEGRTARRPMPGWRMAAAFLLPLAGAALLWRMTVARTPQAAVAAKGNSTGAPAVQIPGIGGKTIGRPPRATLILADGTRVALDSATDGPLVTQGDVTILQRTGGLEYRKPEASRIPASYRASGGPLRRALRIEKNESREMVNTLSTPRGGQYRLQLPDGTRVWLNAGSSIRFPAAFLGRDRRVTLSGEAYFEVAKNPRKPFHVLAGRSDIRVLGTHFNVTAYADEVQQRTTLLEGKVEITTKAGRRALTPGHTASVQAQGAIAIDAATDQAVAWKDGLFRFRETGIREIMRQLERWYDVQTEFDPRVEDPGFTGVMSRSEPLPALLQTLELTGTIHFKIEQRKITVLP